VTQVMTLEELEMIAELCRKHDVIVVSDEVYEWLVYPPQQHIRIGLSCHVTDIDCYRGQHWLSSCFD